MKKILFIQYPKCGTCRKAAKWLEEHNIDVESRNIAEDNPTTEELNKWITRSRIPVSKFFNTSGKIYKEQNLKEKVKTASTEELIELLSSEGMLVKRPLIISDKIILVGFNEEEWNKNLK